MVSEAAIRRERRRVVAGVVAVTGADTGVVGTDAVEVVVPEAATAEAAAVFLKTRRRPPVGRASVVVVVGFRTLRSP